jgi:hypothetical protein
MMSHDGGLFNCAHMTSGISENCSQLLLFLKTILSWNPHSESRRFVRLLMLRILLVEPEYVLLYEQFYWYVLVHEF